ncbi:hypothetical protein HMPREF0198_0922 [Cardiobacterium hominis ATCC 15826]|uniref:Uncharacterized protein n=1 Tax=Cardiobacterium hominis (strain ATCC 15826 / DSM 8339 / NCTC 10426 / 6573) TaxID=638300 RepID=C8N8U4_CARH6|nr:hypothetical protein HMPREF0198_0922 [Cardiobacterium hominis ATCC 15826]
MPRSVKRGRLDEFCVAFSQAAANPPRLLLRVQSAPSATAVAFFCFHEVFDE